MTMQSAIPLRGLDLAAPSSRAGIARFAFPAFLLLNATLFMRPAEIVPELNGLPIYEVIILGCLLATVPELVQRLQIRSLVVNPITVCVLGILAAVVASRVWQSDIARAHYYGQEFLKVVLYYLLLVSLVNSARRLRQFLLALAIYALILNVVALLSYHHIIDLTTVTPFAEGQFQSKRHGPREVVVRLVAAGIYGNPNDLARIIVVGITIAIFAVTRVGCSLPARVFWTAVLGVFIYALQLTYSRGGLLALIAGIVVLFHARYGAKKGAGAILMLLPLLAVFGGRQTDIDTSTGTAQTRIQLWSQGLVAMRSSPIFGIGVAQFREISGTQTHNSFVEAFVEMGFIGGALFTSAFYLAAAGLYAAKSRATQIVDPELRRMQPYILSLVVGTIVGQFSSARSYSLPTYVILGIAAAYLRLLTDAGGPPPARLSRKLVGRLLVVSVVTLVGLHLYTKLNAHF